MKTKSRMMGVVAATATAVALAVGVMQKEADSQGAKTIKIDGSSTVFPITEAVAEEFQKQKKGSVRVTVGVSGTGGGFEKFCSSNPGVRTDISNASRPIKKEEIEACQKSGVEFIELPVAYDALTVVVNKNNKAIDSITVEELRTIWSKESQQKGIKRWNQVNPKWPNAEFKLYGPGLDSGTYDYFKEAILGKNNDIRSDFTPSEDDNVLVQGVARDPNGMGYFGFAYYEENTDKLKALAIVNPETKKPVLPSAQNVLNGSYKPLSRPLYIYVSKASANKPEVKEFVKFYLQNAAKLSRQVGYVPLPAEDYRKAQARFDKGEVGRVPLRAGL
ncbi:MAG: PstS family phosphate ABC transporter substrate-binding protein [Geminocystis sp.]|nr:PstS family phosphate ABC transporter substrate-binding protein [Geminocystis sp.]MCS7146939.1 PstS family phosphate ABC transporter substrate-binding protein [Geminocystis sp.]MDW8115763.1 PstS family phosphate ABC transporter substrate-binding protein [Geminocystis sp.]MDW8463308.1 PstS family phosphate ABC transporter substrate-binding protein [Geminocystis sp.]